MGFDFYNKRIQLVIAFLSVAIGLATLVISYLTNFSVSDPRSADPQRQVCISDSVDQCVNHFLQQMAREERLSFSWMTASGSEYFNASTSGEYIIMPEHDGVCLTYILLRSSEKKAVGEEDVVIMCHRDGVWVIADA